MLKDDVVSNPKQRAFELTFTLFLRGHMHLVCVLYSMVLVVESKRVDCACFVRRRVLILAT